MVNRKFPGPSLRACGAQAEATGLWGGVGLLSVPWCWGRCAGVGLSWPGPQVPAVLSTPVRGAVGPGLAWTWLLSVLLVYAQATFGLTGGWFFSFTAAVQSEVTARCRIARTLGLRRPTHGACIPSVYKPVDPSLGLMRADIGAASLSLFGDPYELDPFDR